MSYCRSGPDSDLYIFGSTSGKYEIYVAGAKHRPGCENINVYEKISNDMSEKEKDNIISEYLDFDYHPFAGEYFDAVTLEQLKNTVTVLNNYGLKVPDSFFSRVNREIDIEKYQSFHDFYNSEIMEAAFGSKMYWVIYNVLNTDWIRQYDEGMLSHAEVVAKCMAVDTQKLFDEFDC